LRRVIIVETARCIRAALETRGRYYPASMPNAGAAALKEAGVRKMQKLSSEIESFVAFLLRARRWDGTPIALSSIIIVKFLLSIFTLTSWNRGNALELFVSCHHHELYEPASYATYLGKRERKAAKRTRSLGRDASQCRIRARADRCAHRHERRPGKLPQGQTLSPNG
jgi:hypothetical protein